MSISFTHNVNGTDLFSFCWRVDIKHTLFLSFKMWMKHHLYLFHLFFIFAIFNFRKDLILIHVLLLQFERILQETFIISSSGNKIECLSIYTMSIYIGSFKTSIYRVSFKMSIYWTCLIAKCLITELLVSRAIYSRELI